MTPTTQPRTEDPPLRGQILLPAVSRAMTRCECAGLTFAEIARFTAAGHSLQTVSAQTGVGSMCTACLPDLHAFLARGAATPE